MYSKDAHWLLLEIVALEKENERLRRENAELAKALGIMVSRDIGMTPLVRALSATGDKQ